VEQLREPARGSRHSAELAVAVITAAVVRTVVAGNECAPHANALACTEPVGNAE
jgi:hypothetical protein